MHVDDICIPKQELGNEENETWEGGKMPTRGL
jgi:hypothetical protein